MALSVFPELMDKLDPEDVNTSLRTLEAYIHYMVERTEFSLTNNFKTVNNLGVTGEALALALNNAVNDLSALASTVAGMTLDVQNKVDKVEGKGLSTNDYTDEDKADVESIDGIEGRVTALEARGGEANVIEVVKRNGTALPVTGKAVDVTVPTNVSDLTNDSGYQTAQQVQTAVDAGLASLLTATVYGPSALVSFDAGAGGLPVRAVRVAAGAGVSSATVYLTGKNLFDKAHAKNEYIGSDGSVTEASNARCSGYIPINGVCTCSVQRIGTGTDNLLRVALYDANKTFLSRKLSSSATAGNYNTVKIDDSTVKYVRAGIFTGSQNIDTMQVELGGSRTSFEAFGGAWTCDPGTGALTPPVMTARAGVNNIWSDEGNITVEYGAFLLALQAEIDGMDNRVTSIEAVLTNAGPILYENAQDVYVETGQTSVMSVKALGAVTYKWEHFWNSWTQPNWEGKDTDTLHIPAATSQMNLRQVRCTITGSGWTIYSRVAYIHVT